jgi:hypothetical protein
LERASQRTISKITLLHETPIARVYVIPNGPFRF